MQTSSEKDMQEAATQPAPPKIVDVDAMEEDQTTTDPAKII